jgi:rubrerythrin
LTSLLKVALDAYESHAVRESLNDEINATKKYREFSKGSTDPAVKKRLSEIGNDEIHHQKELRELLGKTAAMLKVAIGNLAPIERVLKVRKLIDKRISKDRTALSRTFGKMNLGMYAEKSQILNDRQRRVTETARDLHLRKLTQARDMALATPIPTTEHPPNYTQGEPLYYKAVEKMRRQNRAAKIESKIKADAADLRLFRAGQRDDRDFYTFLRGDGTSKAEAQIRNGNRQT